MKTILLISASIWWCKFVHGTSDPITDGQKTIADFKHRYNTTKEVDLVFVLDRSGSVPRQGWISMINFVEDLLEYFTVDKDNTRVSIITYSTIATVDINDLEPGPLSDLENKCTLKWRIEYHIERKVPYGYTATYSALEKAYDVLLDSRPNAKKAVLILTDGRSNIGQPPVKMAFDILSLRWNQTWDGTTLGPQVEMYAFGIENASMSELVSIASTLPNHTFLIPSFHKFEYFARRLHGDKQEERWVLTRGGKCSSCGTKHAHCMCGAKVGQYVCACDPGYERQMSICVACRRGYYKDRLSPEPCTKCPPFTTTPSFGASEVGECELLPGYRVCPPLPSIENGSLFYVTGSGLDEVADTGRPCANVTDGNSCHYRCREGYRLSGSPVMVCQRSGEWDGQAPNCTVIDCGRVEDSLSPVEVAGKKVIIDYVNATTTYGSVVRASCPKGSVDIGRTTWACDKHGRWTKPTNFVCADVSCGPLLLPRDSAAEPDDCGKTKQSLGSVCNVTCRHGYTLTGVSNIECRFDRHTGPFWGPKNDTFCIDTENPTISCPADIEVEVPHMSMNGTVVHYDKVAPRVHDNSRPDLKYRVINAPSDYFFVVGTTPLEYQVSDDAGNTANCIQTIHVKAKTAEVLSCPMDISMDAAGLLTVVTWDEPVIVDSSNNSLEVECRLKSGSEFPAEVKENVCYPKDPNFHGVTCNFNISVNGPECDIPNLVRTPANGALLCTEAHKYPRVCRIHCKIGHNLRRLDPARHTFSCDWDGSWKPPVGHEWPNCYRTIWGKEATIVNDIQIEFAGSCEENKDDIHRSFIGTILTILEDEHGPCPVSTGSTCDVTTAEVHCGPERGRSKRNAEAADVTMSSARIEFVIRAQTNLSDADLEELHEKKGQHPLKPVLDDIYFKMEDSLIDGWSFQSNNVTVDITHLDLTSVDFKKCNQGEIDDSGPSFPKCYACPMGTFQNNRSCEPCPQDSYQDKDGQSHCTACPNNTNTASEGARNLTECRVRCLEDEFGEDGLEPCSPCIPGYHQPNIGQDDCVPCNSTEAPAYCNDTIPSTMAPPSPSAGYFNCTATCKNGTCHVSGGVESCECHPGFAGPSCDVEVDGCSGVDCFNNGSCVDDVDGVVCSCAPGFTGLFCEREVDECASSPCHNDSICMDLIDDYTCYCADGFEGKNCEVDTDNCRGEPCVHGTCVDYTGGYVCDCHQGYTGDNCELIIDLCADTVCDNGGTCVRSINRAECSCLEGYFGQFCSERVNRCDNITCENGGKCLSSDLVNCKCRLGFAGKYCENVVSSDFDLVFSEASVSRYVVMRIQENLGYLTTCLWIRSADKRNYGTIFSYAADSNWLGSHSGNDFTLYDYGGLQIFVNGESVATNVSISDGVWHHVCVTWFSGSGQWQLFIDGRKRAGGYGLAVGAHIQRDGYFVLGQDQDYMGGGFTSRESFVGEMSQLFMVSRVLDEVRFGDLVSSCASTEGDIFSWTDVLAGVTEMVIKRSPSRCLDRNECLQEKVCGSGEYCVDISGSFTCKSCEEFNLCRRGVSVHNESHHVDTVDTVCSADGECFYGNLDPVSGCFNPQDSKYSHDKKYEARLKCSLCPGEYPDVLEGEDGVGSEGAENDDCRCSFYPCQNDGTCVYTGMTERCLCPQGFTGTYCDVVTHRQQCQNITCQHGGYCTTNGTERGCACPEGWRGRYCHVQFSPSCDHSPCVNNGSCVPSNGSLTYQCLCEGQPGKRLGPNCEDLSPCWSSPCLNDGACVRLSGVTVICKCRPGFGGLRCEFPYSTVTTSGYIEEALVTRPRQPTSDQWETTLQTEIDYCANVACDNGGTCIENKDGFQCRCKMDFYGLYCGQRRETSATKYRVKLTLLMDYTPALAHDVHFKEQFKQQVHKTYLEAAKDSKLHINIISLSEGSVLVEFMMVHTTYLDSSALGPRAMEDTLGRALIAGKLGDLPASVLNFQFNPVEDDPSPADRSVLYIVIGVLVFAILTVLLIIGGVYICRGRGRGRPTGVRYYNAPSKHALQNNIGNPAFEPDSEPTTPSCIKDDNIYAEPGEYLLPYSVTTFKDVPETDLNQRYPSKRGRDINKDWDRNISRQSIPLPPKPDNIDESDYTPPDRGIAPPRYSQVSAADFDTLRSSYADKSLEIRSKHTTAQPLSEEGEKGDLVQTGSVKSRGSLVGDNPGFEDTTYLEPKAVRADDSEYSLGTIIPPPEAPLYLEILHDTPPPEGDAVHGHLIEGSTQSAAPLSSETDMESTRM